ARGSGLGARGHRNRERCIVRQVRPPPQPERCIVRQVRPPPQPERCIVRQAEQLTPPPVSPSGSERCLTRLPYRRTLPYAAESEFLPQNSALAILGVAELSVHGLNWASPHSCGPQRSAFVPSPLPEGGGKTAGTRGIDCSTTLTATCRTGASSPARSLDP